MILDTLMVKITGDVSGLSKSTSKAKEEISGLGSSVSSTSGKFSSFASSVASSAFGNIIADLASKATEALGQLAAEAVEASDSTQKFAQTLQFAGLDTSTIERLTESTKAYADQTVYSLTDVRSITSQLAANGVKDYDKLAEAAGNLNAVAGGTADTYKTVGMVLTQTAGQGKLTAENWNQLSDAIPGATGKIQQALLDMGAYTGNFRDAMSEGEISAEEFNQALLELGMTDIAKEAATATTTFEGSIGNLQASIVSLITGGLDLIKPAATGAINSLTGIVESFTSMSGSFVGTLSGAISEMPEAFAELNTEMGGAAQMGDYAAMAIQSIGNAFGISATQMSPFLDAIAGIGNSLQNTLVAALNAAQPYILSIVSSMNEFGNVLSANIMPVITSFVGMITQLGSTVLAALTPAFQTLVPILMQIANMFIQFGTSLASTVLPALTNIFNTLTQVFTALQPIVVGAMTQIMAVVQTVWPSIQSTIEGVMNAIQAIVSTVMAVIQGVINVVLSAINGDWSGVMNGLQSIASAVWNGIQGVISGVMQAISGVISTVLGTINGVWNSVWNTISSFLNGVMRSIKSAVSNGLNNVVSFFRNLPGNILSALGNLGSLLFEAGSSIVSGLLSGIESAIGGVYDFVSGIGSQIASLKGPIPYDLKLLIPNGQAIMKSLLTGITDGAEDVYDEVSGIGNEIVDRMSNEYKMSFVPEVDWPEGFTLKPAGSSGLVAQGETTTVNIQNLYVNKEDVDSGDLPADIEKIIRDYRMG